MANGVKFAAALSIRTPARLQNELERMKTEMPAIIDDTLKKVVKMLEEKTPIDKNRPKISDDIAKYLPIRLSKEPAPELDMLYLKVETVVGRSMWLYGIMHTLTNTVKILLQYKWSIMRSACGERWITSDDPVIPLNYFGDGSYDFGGGWGRKGSEILLPLSPQHMLYTKVGEKSKSRIDVNYKVTMELNKIIAHHADRIIFAPNPIYDIESIRSRKVDPEAYKNEQEAWMRWHEEQSSEEEKYFTD